jgi:uncharacterized protein (DUF362 family)/ferredoxin
MKSKVAIVRCGSYEIEEVFRAVETGISLLGGWKEFFSPGEKILLKPNMLFGKAPDKQATTHPAVFEAVVRSLSVYNNHLTYGDSPGFGRPEKVAETTGISEAAARFKVPLADFETGETVSFPDGAKSKRFDLARGVLEAEAILSLPKMKSHQLTRITGAVKNQLGCVYGFNKAGFHAKFPDAVDFSQMLVDLNRLLKPRFFIMDGITAMEGNGPASGDPVPMGVLILSNDPVAVDATFCRMISMPTKYVPTVTFGEEAGLGNADEGNIEYLGVSWSEVAKPDFNVLRRPVQNESIRLGVIMPRLKGVLIRRPVIDPKLCIKCGICVDACPVEGKALDFKGGNRSKPPVYNYRKCIRCYCCQEMCPKMAITVKTPLAGRLLLYRD